MSKLIIGLVGMPGAGKGTAAQHLKEKYGAAMYRFSMVLGDLVKRLSLPTSRENLIKMSEAIRQHFGEDILAFALEKDATGDAAPIVVIDGIRRLQDLAALEPLPQFKLVAIEAPAEIRYQRMLGRGEKAGESEMTWEQFLAQEQMPTELTIPQVIARATHQVDNSGDIESLKKQLDEILAQYL